MENDNILELALIISFIGLLVLSVIAYFSEPQKVSIALLEENLGRKVVVEGVVERVTLKPSVSFITLSEGKSSADIIFFGLPSDHIKSGSKLRIVGKVERYKGKIELLAEDIFYA